MRPLGVIRVIRGWFVFVLLPKCGGNIAEDVFDGLTAYAEANKTIADRVAAPAGSPIRAHRGMAGPPLDGDAACGHPGGALDQNRHPACHVARGSPITRTTATSGVGWLINAYIVCRLSPVTNGTSDRRSAPGGRCSGCAYNRQPLSG